MLTLAALAACTRSEPGEYARVEVTGLEPGRGLAWIDAPMVTEVRFFDEHDRPVEPAWFQWLGAANPLLPPEPEKTTVVLEEELGVRRATVTMHALGRLELTGFSRRCDTCGDDVYGPAEYWVSAPADRVEPLMPDATSLVVGERRPFTALGLVSGVESGIPAAQLTRSHEPLAVTVDDETIATVDEDGVVQALAPGVTSVRFTGARASAVVSLEVRDGTLGPPPDGIHDLLGDKALTGAPRFLTAARSDSSIAIDDRGWPTVVVQPLIDTGYVLNLAALATWTGSGFGVELVGDFLDNVGTVGLARDGRGRQYVAYTTGSALWQVNLPRTIIAERPSDGGPGDWTYRDLPRRPRVDYGAEVDPWVDPDEVGVSDGNLALLGRPEGVWASYVVVGYNVARTSTADDCAQVLRWVAVDDDAIVAEDAQTQLSSADECGRYTPPVFNHQVFVMPPLFPDGLPSLATLTSPPMWDHQYREVDRLDRTALGWQPAVRMIPPPSAEYDNLSVYGVQWLAPVLPMPDSGEPHWAWSRYGGDVNVFGFAAQGSVWTGVVGFDGLSRTGPYGHVGADDPSVLLADPALDASNPDPAPPEGTIAGYSAGADRLHWLFIGRYGDLGYAVATPPQPLLHDDGESLGARFGTDPDAPVVDAPAWPLPDGARVATLYRWEPTDTGPVLTNELAWTEGADAVWSFVPVDAARTVFGSDWFDLGGRIVGTARDADGNLEIVQVDLASPGVAPLVEVAAGGDPSRVVHVGAAVFALGRPPSGPMALWYSPDPVSGEPLVDRLSGVPTAPAAADRRDLSLLVDGEEVLLLAAGSPGRLGLHAFGADGALLATSEVDVPSGVGQVLIATAGVAPDGSLFVFARDAGAHHHLLRSTDRLATLEEVARWDEPWLSPTAIVALSDGRLAFSAARRMRPDVWKAVTYTSGDGVVWSDPRLVRGGGGNGQRAVGLAPDAAGGALVTLVDDGAMRAGGPTSPDQFVTYSAAAPIGESGVVHVEP